MIRKDSKFGAMLVDYQVRIQLHTAMPESKGVGESPESEARAFMKDVFAIGDNSIPESGALPATTKTADQQVLWLGKHLNKDDIETETFSFKNMGIMAYLGDAGGLV